MANWLERAQREIQENAKRDTANSAERNPTAAMAVPAWAKSDVSKASDDGIDGTTTECFQEKVEILIALKTESRRQKVTSMLSGDPTIRYAVTSDMEVDPDAVIVTVGIRGAGTCELSIPKATSDPFKLIELTDGRNRLH